jgi:hypothetical protein
VGTAQLKNAAVTGQKVAKDTLTGANINFAKLGTVPDSADLGGVPAAGWQRLVSGSCLGNTAISKINVDGTVSCQATGTGTLTGVGGAANSGITGGGNTGNVTLGIDPTVIQKRLSGGCQSGQAITAVAQDGTPACQAFGSGNGTITAVTAGPGLNGGGSSGGVGLEVDFAAVQQRLNSACTPGLAIVAVAQDGTPSCQGFQRGLTAGCPPGQALTGFTVTGTPACQAFGSGNGTITGVSAGTGLTGGGSSGSVGLAVATGGIGTAQLADGSVTTAKLASGAVAPNSAQLNGLPAGDYGNTTWQVIVNGNGTTQFAHAGMTVVRNSVGNYTVSWTGFPGNGTALPYCTGNGRNGTVSNISVVAGSGSFIIDFAGVDTIFNCVIIGI